MLLDHRTISFILPTYNSRQIFRHYGSHALECILQQEIRLPWLWDPVPYAQTIHEVPDSSPGCRRSVSPLGRGTAQTRDRCGSLAFREMDLEKWIKLNVGLNSEGKTRKEWIDCFPSSQFFSPGLYLFWRKYKNKKFSLNMHLKCRLQNVDQFVPISRC